MTNTQIQKRIETNETTPKPHGNALEAARWALDAALGKKALEPLLLKVDDLCSYTEYILLVSGRSDRQVDAISAAISMRLRQAGRRPLGVEGGNKGQWSLLDFGDLVVHVFHHPTRGHYDLEGLWSDAPRVQLEIPAEARISAEDDY